MRRAKTNLDRHGVSNVFQRDDVREKALRLAHSDEAKLKREETSLEKYGVKNPAQNEEIKAKSLEVQRSRNGGLLGFHTPKAAETLLENYGVIHPMASPEIREKVRQSQFEKYGSYGFNTKKQKETMLERYGSPGALGSPEIFEKQKETMVSRHGVERPSQHPDFLEKSLRTIIENNGHLFGSDKISKINRAFAEDIHRLTGENPLFEHQIEGKFFDLYYPSHKLLIDLNPTVTHNSTIAFSCLRNKCSQPCEKHTPLARGYHEKRSLLAQKHDLSLIQVFDWDSRSGLLKMISAKLGMKQRKISARKTTMKKISQTEANSFLDEAHVQGGSSKQKHCYGLHVDGELLAVATFSPSRFRKTHEWEWNRFAVKFGWRIHGASGKLWRSFLSDVSPESVISYVDFNHTTRKTFLDSLEFVQQGRTGPTKMWHRQKDGLVINGRSLSAIGADRLLGTNYGSRQASGKTNGDILRDEGFLEVYNAGNLIYTWRSKEEIVIE